MVVVDEFSKNGLVVVVVMPCAAGEKSGLVEPNAKLPWKAGCCGGFVVAKIPPPPPPLAVENGLALFTAAVSSFGGGCFCEKGCTKPKGSVAPAAALAPNNNGCLAKKGLVAGGEVVTPPGGGVRVAAEENAMLGDGVVGGGVQSKGLGVTAAAAVPSLRLIPTTKGRLFSTFVLLLLLLLFPSIAAVALLLLLLLLVVVVPSGTILGGDTKENRLDGDKGMVADLTVSNLLRAR